MGKLRGLLMVMMLLVMLLSVPMVAMGQEATAQSDSTSATAQSDSTSATAQSDSTSATAQSDSTSPEPVAVVQDVAVADGIEVGGVGVSFNFILQIIQWGVTVVFFVLIYKSVPSNLVDDGIRLARKGALKTDSPLDDEIVEMIARLVAQYRDKEESKPEGATAVSDPST